MYVRNTYVSMYVGKVQKISDKFGKFRQIQTNKIFIKNSYLIKLLDDCLQEFVKTRECTVVYTYVGVRVCI